MWVDNETDTDFLNFSGVADTVAEIIYSANGRPISIGVAGAGGAVRALVLWRPGARRARQAAASN